MEFRPGMTDAEKAACAAARLVMLFELDAPRIIIGREWALLWRHMTSAFGEGLLHEGEADFDSPPELGEPECN